MQYFSLQNYTAAPNGYFKGKCIGSEAVTYAQRSVRSIWTQAVTEIVAYIERTQVGIYHCIYNLQQVYTGHYTNGYIAVAAVIIAVGSNLLTLVIGIIGVHGITGQANGCTVRIAGTGKTDLITGQKVRRTCKSAVNKGQFPVTAVVYLAQARKPYSHPGSLYRVARGNIPHPWPFAATLNRGIGRYFYFAAANRRTFRGFGCLCHGRKCNYQVYENTRQAFMQ